MRKVRPPSRQEQLDRRGFFRFAGRLGLGSLLVAEAAALADCGGSAGPTTAPGVPAPDFASAVTRPPEIAGGTLVASVGTQSIWPGATTAVWTLGGSFPGPTIRVGRGASFSARIENRLSEPTNVHWHGLAAPPEMDGHPSDVIAPGQSRDIAFPIVDRAGTYWYHPHPDGRTARQVYGGMAGFFIVEDGREAALGLPSGEYDVPLVLQDRRTSSDHALTYAPGPMDLMAGVLGDAVLVNGRPDAVLPVAATLYRLRLLNGSNARVYRLAFADGRSFPVIGTDGGLLERPVSVTAVDLGPGERVEFLVDLARDPIGTSILLKSLAFSVPGGMGGGMMPGNVAMASMKPCSRSVVLAEPSCRRIMITLPLPPSVSPRCLPARRPAPRLLVETRLTGSSLSSFESNVTTGMPARTALATGWRSALSSRGARSMPSMPRETSVSTTLI